MRSLTPVVVDGFEHELDARRERDESIGAGTDRRLLEAIVPDLRDVGLGHDPSRAGRARVEGEEIRPRLLEAKPDARRPRSLDRRHPFLEGLARGASVALEGELDVLGTERIAVVESHTVSQDELVHEPIRRERPGLGETGRERVTGQRLHHRVVQRVHQHEGCHDPRGFGGVEPRRDERDVNPPGHLTFRRRRGPHDAGGQDHQNEDHRRGGADPSHGERLPWRLKRFTAS